MFGIEKKDADKAERKPSFLDKEINFKDFNISNLKYAVKNLKKKNDALPSKDTMNLYKKERKKIDKKTIILVILGILLIVFLKFGVFDPLMELHKDKVKLEDLSNQNLALQHQLVGYADIQEEYYRYGYDYLTPEEAAIVDREEIIKIVDDAVEYFGKVVTLSITGNQVSAIVYTPNLDNVSAIRQVLESYNCVNNVSVYYAAKGGAENVSVNSSVVFNVIKIVEVTEDEDSGNGNSGSSNSGNEQTDETGGEQQ